MVKGIIKVKGNLEQEKIQLTLEQSVLAALTTHTVKNLQITLSPQSLTTK